MVIGSRRHEYKVQQAMPAPIALQSRIRTLDVPERRKHTNGLTKCQRWWCHFGPWPHSARAEILYANADAKLDTERPHISISKVKSWTPTRLSFGEGQRGVGKQPTDAPVLVHRGSRVIGGDPWWARVAASTTLSGVGLRGSRTWVIRPMKPGNAGGGKDPDFWCALDGEEDW